MFVSVDGTGFGITNGGVGSNRYRVSYTGPGGHSYGAFGMPNPIHAMGRAIAGIAELEATTDPKVTFNVGVVSGVPVNSIPDKGRDGDRPSQRIGCGAGGDRCTR